MSEYLLKEKGKLKELFDELSIPIDLDHIHTTGDLFNKIENRRDKDFILKKLILHSISCIIINRAGLKKEDLANAETRKYMKALISISWKERLKFPPAHLTTKSFIFITIVLLLTLGLMVTFFFYEPLAFLVVLDLKISILFLLGPVFAIMALFPKVFFSMDYKESKKMNSLIISLYSLNGERYLQQNYLRLKDELIRYTTDNTKK